MVPPNKFCPASLSIFFDSAAGTPVLGITRKNNEIEIGGGWFVSKKITNSNLGRVLFSVLSSFVFVPFMRFNVPKTFRVHPVGYPIFTGFSLTLVTCYFVMLLSLLSFSKIGPSSVSHFESCTNGARVFRVSKLFSIFFIASEKILKALWNPQRINSPAMQRFSPQYLNAIEPTLE